MARDQLNPYERFQSRELTLNDLLAIDRTILANDRSLLAVGRTVLTMVAIGGTTIEYFDDQRMRALGVLLLVGASALAVWGWRHYKQTTRRLAVALEQRTGAPEHPLEKEAEAARKDPLS